MPVNVLSNSRGFRSGQSRICGLDVLNEPTDSFRLVIFNLMPNKIATERQFIRLFDDLDTDIDLFFARMECYQPTNTSADHLDDLYFTLSQLRGHRFDGLIVTGAPVEKLAFEEVKYWPEFLDVLAWAEEAVARRFFICWAALGALHARCAIPKIVLDSKLFGVYEQSVLAPGHGLMRGLPARFVTPVSRHCSVSRAAVEACGELRTLVAAGDEVCLVASRDGREAYMLNHLEYDADTLWLEYNRDLARGLPIEAPANCAGDTDARTTPAVAPWRGTALAFFRNWLDFQPLEATSAVRAPTRPAAGLARQERSA